MNELDLDVVLRVELGRSEHIVWQTQPNVDAVRGSLLTSSLLTLSGVFLLAAGILRSSIDDSQILSLLVLVLAVVAGAGVLELTFVPRRAGRTVYVLTNRRLFSLVVAKRLFKQENSDPRNKEVVKVTKYSVPLFYTAYLFPLAVFCYCSFDIISSLVHSFDSLIAVGYLVVVAGWLKPCYDNMRVPLAKYRDAPRTFYSIGDLFVFLESFDLTEIAEFVYQPGREKTFNAYVISKSSGCIRMRAIPEVKPVQLALEQVPKG
jgi:uncharacterized membrane protein